MPNREPRNLCRLHAHGQWPIWSRTVEEALRCHSSGIISALENLCSWHRGPGVACVIPHLSPLHTLPKAQAAYENGRFDTNPIPNPKHCLGFLVVDFYLKCSWLFYFEILMEVHLGVVRLRGYKAFTIHISLHDYFKSMFCRIWLMYCVFFKTGLKYENWQKWSYYKEWSIFNNLLKGGKWSAAQKCTDRDSATFCNQHWAAKTSSAFRFRHN